MTPADWGTHFSWSTKTTTEEYKTEEKQKVNEDLSNSVKVLTHTKHPNLKDWSLSGRVIEIPSDSGIYELLVMSKEESLHSTAPVSVILEFEDGFQYRFTLYHEKCEACGQLLPK